MMNGSPKSTFAAADSVGGCSGSLPGSPEEQASMLRLIAKVTQKEFFIADCKLSTCHQFIYLSSMPNRFTNASYSLLEMVIMHPCRTEGGRLYLSQSA